MTKGFTSTGRRIQTSNRIPPRQIGMPMGPPKKGSGPLPDRASIDRASPFYSDFDGGLVGIRLNGQYRPQNDVVEYCMSEGWILVPARKAGKIHKERGRAVLMTITGEVEAFWR